MSLEPYRIPLWRRIVRPVIRFVLRLIFRILARVRITGRENIPAGSPYVVAFNHVSIFDPPFIGSFWPISLEAIGAVDLWHRPGQDVLVKLYGGIPVHRGEYDRRLMDTIFSLLGSGRSLLIAPEGGRSHAPGMRQAKPGVAYVLDVSGVPVIPVGIVGTTDDFWHKASRGQRPVLEMNIGRPMKLPPLHGAGAEMRSSRQENADLVMAHIAGLLPEEYRGVYAGRAIQPAQTDQ